MKRIAIGTVLALVVAKLVLGGIRSRQKVRITGSEANG